MVKICPTCKKFVPLSATACPMCGNKKLVVANAPMTSPAPSPTVTKPPKRKKSKAPIIAISLLALVIIISIPIAVIFLNPCRSGHSWKQATCTAPLTCSVCGETSGEKLGHKWTGATCSEPAVCSRCGEKSYSEKKEHKYSTTGICSVCNATKEYGNSYCYVSKSDLYAMAKDALEDYMYPSYVSDYCSSSKIIIDKVTDPKLLYGADSFTVGAYADFTINGVIFEQKKFAVVIEPRNSTQYVRKDVYVQLTEPTVIH